MPRRNRVDPFGAIAAVADRGLFLGNRGGRFHRDDGTLLAREQATKQWICCVLAFKGRRRQVMAEGYTELFFLDEVTALSAGHRPCFECRRHDAQAFAAAWARAKGLATPPRAPEMDQVLDSERRNAGHKRRHELLLQSLPDGAMIAIDRQAYAVRGASILPWFYGGYGPPRPRPTGMAVVLTPPSIIAGLQAGFEPHWHPSADAAP